MVLGGACLSRKEMCSVENARVRKSGFRWGMLE